MTEEDFTVLSRRLAKDIIERVQVLIEIYMREHGAIETKAMFTGALGMATGTMIDTIANELPLPEQQAALKDTFLKLYNETLNQHNREYGSRILTN